MDDERNLSIDKKFAFNISFIMLLGFFFLACSNRSISNNNPITDNSNQLDPDISEVSEISDPDDIDLSDGLNVGDLTTALVADGYTEDEIMDALNAIISAAEDSSDISVSCLQFMDLMTVLKTSQAEREQMKDIRDTNSGLIEKILCGNLASSSSFDPEMELSSKYPNCPTIPNTAPTIPPGPYDEQLGDCALWGKSDEIDAWLTELEQIAASCQANREPNWAATVAARATLDVMIDKLEEIETPQNPEGGTSVNTGVNLVLGLLQQVFGSARSVTGNSSGPGEGMLNTPPHYYTDRLQSMGENVEIYCTMIDEIIKPLWLACIEISLHQEGGAPDLDLYHSIIELGMNDAQANYDSSDLFFTNALQTDGWDDFRSSYSAVLLDCPLDPQGPDTRFTFSQNAFCRKGPSSKYEEVATFLEGQVVQIEGRNHHEPRWWVIPNPGARGNCWVSDSTGAAEGPLEELVIVAPPPLVINKPNNDQSNTCSKDLGSSVCAAAGGSWVDGGATGASYCDCP